MKTLEELIDLKEPGWELVSEWLSEAKNEFEILPTDKKRVEKELLNA